MNQVWRPREAISLSKVSVARALKDVALRSSAPDVRVPIVSWMPVNVQPQLDKSPSGKQAQNTASS